MFSSFVFLFSFLLFFSFFFFFFFFFFLSCLFFFFFFFSFFFLFFSSFFHFLFSFFLFFCFLFVFVLLRFYFFPFFRSFFPHFFLSCTYLICECTVSTIKHNNIIIYRTKSPILVQGRRITCRIQTETGADIMLEDEAVRTATSRSTRRILALKTASPVLNAARR